MKKLILCAILCTGVLCGCTGSKFIMTKNPDSYPNVQKYSERDHFFFWGMSRKHDHDFSAICPNGKVVKMVTNNDWIDELLVSLTMGVYYTRTFTAYCVPDSSAADKAKK